MEAKKPATKKPAGTKKPALTKTATAPTTKKPDDAAAQTFLADICKVLKMEPRAARRVLRNAKVKVDGGRWTWKKGSAEIENVTKLLKDSQVVKAN